MNCVKCGNTTDTSMLCRGCAIDKTYDIAYNNGVCDEKERIINMLTEYFVAVKIGKGQGTIDQLRRNDFIDVLIEAIKGDK